MFLAALGKIHFWPPLETILPTSMTVVCLTQGIVYRLQTLLHWCDNNAVFIVGVSRVQANSLPLKIGKKENQSVHTHCVSETFQSGTRTKG